MKKKGCLIGCGVVLLAVLVAAALLIGLLFGGNAETTEDISYYQALSGEIDGPNSLPILGE